ncbi:unnamed protein product [Didymodactylos carnosus]|uniref:Uncharacterized protein n=1 Tax=Didymodactylos carnosus TaxID=1234261 RepID=A0A814QSK7_9BILA|nr:unnamed protein product [Didymodactylos carnosus]CAF3888019.1 unnamed protein product [Didymodactylos carnosus]
MTSKAQDSKQIRIMLRAFVGAAIPMSPYFIMTGLPDQTVDYVYDRVHTPDGKFMKPNQNYGNMIVEILMRFKITKVMERAKNFDIRTFIHSGGDFHLYGHFTPLFNGNRYLMIPQWSNLTNFNELKNLKIDYYGHTFDFSKFDLSQIDQTKFQFQRQTSLLTNKEQSVVQTPNTKEKKEDEIKKTTWANRLSGWFGFKRPETNDELKRLETPTLQPVLHLQRSQETIDLEELIGTLCLSDEAKKFAISDQIQLSTSITRFIPWMLCTTIAFSSPFYLYYSGRLQFKTRTKRYLFFTFCLAHSILFVYFSPLAVRKINQQFQTLRDKSTVMHGLDLFEGSIEYLEKKLKRQQILRKYLQNGEQLFNEDGEQKKIKIKLFGSEQWKLPFYTYQSPLKSRLRTLNNRLTQLLTNDEKDIEKLFSISRSDTPSNASQQPQQQYPFLSAQQRALSSSGPLSTTQQDNHSVSNT